MKNIIKKDYKPESLQYQFDFDENHTILFSTSYQSGSETEKSEPGGGGAKIYYNVPIFSTRIDYIFNISNNLEELNNLGYIKKKEILNYKELENWLFEKQELLIKNYVYPHYCT